MLALSPVCTRLLLAPKTPGVQIRKDSRYHKVILNREREGIRAGGGERRRKRKGRPRGTEQERKKRGGRNGPGKS